MKYCKACKRQLTGVSQATQTKLINAIDWRVEIKQIEKGVLIAMAIPMQIKSINMPRGFVLGRTSPAQTPESELLLMNSGYDSYGFYTTVIFLSSTHFVHKVQDYPTQAEHEQWQAIVVYWHLISVTTATMNNNQVFIFTLFAYIYKTPFTYFNMKAQTFGKKRLADFYLDPDYININHGSYGSCPRVVMAAKRKLEEQMDFNTQKWFRFDSQQLLNKTRQTVAKRVQCQTKNLFIVQNATDAFNALAKSLVWKAGDTIALPNTAYASIRKTVQWLRDRYGIKILNIEFTIQDFKSMQAVQIKVQDTINSYPSKISLVVIDHIVSVPGIVMPIGSLNQFFEEKGIPVFIDGAHAMCQVQIDLSELTVDAYFSNFHKWAYAPKNAAFLYISDKYLNIVRPAITGNFRGQGPERQFFWTGTRDFTSYMVIDKGLQYYDSFGFNAVNFYNKSLSIEAANKMAEIWKTKKLTQDNRMMCYLNNVEVPSNDIDLCVRLAKKMMNESNCYPIFYKFNNKVYCRISAQIYNQISDYVFAATTFLNLLKAQTEAKIKEQV